LVETLSILSILISRFPALLSNASLAPEPLTVLAPLLSHQRPVVRKRAIITLSQFIPISRPELFNELVSTNVLPYLDPTANIEKYRTTIQLIAAVARHSPIQLAPILQQIVPGLLKAAQKDDDELREGSLQVRCSFINFELRIDGVFDQALEAIVLRCPVEVTSYLEAIIQAGNQYIKYDPVGSLPFTSDI
jgi:cullin-associated NEDD8-dissociated protein 1